MQGQHPTPDPSGPGPAGGRQRQLGDFVIERELGRGGMGVVWLATQKSLGRKVALKVLPSFATMDIEAVQRFRREAEATGRIRHPGIVPVYGVGEVDGIHWFAMEFIDGPPLGSLLEALSLRHADKLRASLIEEAQLGSRYPSLREPPATGAGNAYVRSCARLCAEVANALAAAHREHVVHRDLKPNNILIHPAGRAVLVDFGLARDERSTGLTRTGEQIGTPAYMAPEQARGHREVDARADVYGLGAVLYELLALRPPFEGNTSSEIVHRILTEEPLPVRRHNPTVPVDLAAIVHKCLAKSPEQRYPAVEALELDLREFLAGRPVSATLPGPVARLHGILQRHRRSLLIGAAVAGTTTVLAVLAGLVDDRNAVRQGHEKLDEARQLLVERRDVERARDLYEQAAALTKQPDLVRTRRRQDFRDAFARYYDDKPAGPEALRRFEAVFDADDRQQLRDLLDRLAGRGSLTFPSRVLEARTGALEVRRVLPDGLQADWCPVHAGDPLPTGEYLVRATARDGAMAFLWAKVSADAETALSPCYVDAGTLPPDHVAVLDPATGLGMTVSRFEVTRGEWRQWLSELGPELAEAMRPLDWDGGEQKPDAAVRGLSFHQARAFAGAHGAHLPTAREQWLAGSAGLQGLALPWGSTPDSARVAADPFHMQDTESVRSRAEGQSPLGVFHVLGNAAEVLSAADGSAPAMGGGSFLDDPATLRLYGDRGAVPTAPLPGVFRGHVGAGLRLYRFLPPPDQPQLATAAKARREELRTGSASFVFHDWELLRDGSVRCELELNGRYDGRDRRISVPFDTPGYLQRPGQVQALDGHRRPLPTDARTARGGESSWLFTELAADLREGQGYRYFVSATLLPTDGLLPKADGYVLRLPMKRDSRLGQLYTLTLPAGCRLLAEPTPPATIYTQDGRTTMTWEQSAGGQIETAVVQFRSDGMFGQGLLGKGQVEKRTRQLLNAWNDRSSMLGPLLDRDFLRRPHNLDKEAALAHEAGETLALVEVADAVRVGSVETVSLLVDWQMADRGGRPFTLERWPFVVQWLLDGDEARVLRLNPRTIADQGRYDGSSYVHDDLRVRILPVADSVLSRTQSELSELQVSLRNGALTAQVLGHFAEPNEPASTIRFRLTNGAAVLRPGKSLDDAAAPGAATQDWVFPVGGAFSRERWTFLQNGRRYLLVRFAATERTPEAAEKLFAGDEAQRWFTAVREAIRIE